MRYDFVPASHPSRANLTEEELVFSFSTSTTPSILVYVSSWTQDYLAVVLRHNGGTHTQAHAHIFMRAPPTLSCEGNLKG